MTLRDTTSFLVRATDVAEWIKLADSYIQAYNRVPESFVLPQKHSVLHPLIESFATDTDAFSNYIRALRDASDGSQYDDLHNLYRTISLRALQVTRRTRLRKATMLILAEVEQVLERTVPYDEQLRLAKIIEQIWGELRTTMLDDSRRVLKVKRNSREGMTAMLSEFWEDIDKQLDDGKVPLGHYSIKHIAERLVDK